MLAPPVGDGIIHHAGQPSVQGVTISSPAAKTPAQSPSNSARPLLRYSNSENGAGVWNRKRREYEDFGGRFAKKMSLDTCLACCGDESTTPGASGVEWARMGLSTEESPEVACGGIVAKRLKPLETVGAR